MSVRKCERKMSKKAHVAVSREENVIVLRCYLQNPSNWSCVLEEVRVNMHLLPSNARELYKSGNLPWEKVRRRMADQVSKWTNADPEKIDDGEMKVLVKEVQKIRQKYSEKKAPEKRTEDGNLPKVRKVQLLFLIKTHLRYYPSQICSIYRSILFHNYSHSYTRKIPMISLFIHKSY